MPGNSSRGRPWWAGILAVTVLALAAGFAGAARATKTVRLVIDFGDGVETHFTALPWHEGMTVLGALEAAAKHPRGVKFRHRGSGSFAMVTQIGDLANQGGGADSKNWLYSVNEKPAVVGAGSYDLKPGDTVLWRFRTYDYNSE